MSAAARPLLYTYRRCPYAMRARMALLAAGVEFDAFDIVLRDKPQALREISPKATVPVLLLPTARVLEQSWDIVQWALTQEAAPASCQDAWRRAQTPANQALLGINDGVFKQHLDRYKYPERFAGSGDVTASADVRAHHRQQGLQVLRRAHTHQGVRACGDAKGVAAL